MKIVLIRHATPDVDNSKCSALQAKERLRQYNSTENILLDEIDDFIKSTEYQEILTIKNIFVSPLIRARKTAKYLFGNREFNYLDELKEFDLNIFFLPLIKLSLSNWFLLSRLLWFIRINRKGCPPKIEKTRVANIIQEMLSQEAIIVSHGLILREIGKYLKKKQFSQTFAYKNGCFQVKVFNRNV
ncbi:phosphoglycerate mutase family protein [Pasteurellaceae bacterium LIM206]|nr:phosphoglycerate mutase family protein [Pasteurellaceae bacterium LIM206]